MNLNGIDFHDTILTSANLYGVQLTNSILSGTDLSGAHLVKADLSDSYLVRADLTGANLQAACLDRVSFGLTVLANIRLLDVKGLESCLHQAPSSLGIDTFF
jgi:uncharacterized protein YjbI with pentapeptide repeats